MELDQQVARTRLIRTPNGPKKKTPKSARSAEQKKSRFVEPYRFDDKKRAALMKTLQKCQLGDSEGQRLFVAALEFELGTVREMSLDRAQPQASPAPKTASHPQLPGVGEAARALHTLLERLTPEDREALAKSLTENDRFKRTYDDRYLREMEYELDHLAQACAAETEVQSEPEIQPDTATSEKFYAMLSNAFRECFDQTPTAGKNKPFHRVARRVIELTELCVRQDAEFIDACLTN